MLMFDRFSKIYLYRPYVDFRKGIDGLSGIVQEQMKLSPFENYLFIFCSSGRSKLKILYWEDSGFALWQKRLEEEKFKWPAHLQGESICVDLEKVRNFLCGLDPWQVPHKKLTFSEV